MNLHWKLFVSYHLLSIIQNWECQLIHGQFIFAFFVVTYHVQENLLYLPHRDILRTDNSSNNRLVSDSPCHGQARA